MYVIYINERPLRLCSSSEPRTSARAQEGTHLVVRYLGKPRTLLQYADMLEKGSPKVLSVDIVADDLNELWADFRSKYKWVPAAGGLVRLKGTDNYLFIYRRGSWDLPKGKIDEGEDPPAAALREVEEETGVRDLTLGPVLPTTYHTYRSGKDKRILKPTYWFRMETDQQLLTPEEGEGIELAEWRTVRTILDADVPFYASLKWLLKSS